MEEGRRSKEDREREMQQNVEEREELEKRSGKVVTDAAVGG